MTLKSSLARHCVSGVPESERRKRVQSAEAELHRAGIGLVRYDDEDVPWEIRMRVETIQQRKHGKRTI